MTIEDWLAAACADADRRGLADLKPLLASLADATRALRSAGWERAAGVQPDAGSPEPAAPAPPPAGQAGP
jgi:hypothetical protein